ncbi:MAG: ABC transporter ATP-binding protein [Pelagimonas sp.]
MSTTESGSAETKRVATTSDTLSIANRLLREALASRWRLYLVSLVCMIGVAIFTGALAYTTRLIVNDVFVSDNTNAAFGVAGLVVFVAFFKSIFQYGNSVIMTVFQRSVSVSYQKQLFDKLIHDDVRRFSGQHASNQMSQLRLFGTAAGNGVINTTNKLLTDTLTLLALFGVMVMQDPWMTLGCLVIIPVIFYLVASLSHRIREAADEEADLTGAFFEVGVEAFDGIKTVKSYQLETRTSTRFNAAIERLEERLFGIAKVTAATVPIMEFLGGLVIGSFVVYAAWQTISNGKTPGEFTAFITAFLMAYQPAERISRIWVELQKSMVQTGKMYELLDRKDQGPKSGTQTIGADAPTVRFEKVSFFYSPEAPALTNVDVSIRAGERVAIVGPSGAGKSTFIDLLLRFYDPTGGRILIGETDLRDVTHRSLRDSIALISQDVFLFDGTLRDNIRDGKSDATDTEIEIAAQRAQLGDFLASQELALDTPVGPNGRFLSGGQKQRVGIARALVKQAKVLVFDEATSALDVENERRIMNMLRDELRDPTVFFVTHRPATLAYVDRVLMLKAGEVVGFDTKLALETENAAFHELFQPAGEA